jgi:hypothetical protein
VEGFLSDFVDGCGVTGLRYRLAGMPYRSQHYAMTGAGRDA